MLGSIPSGSTLRRETCAVLARKVDQNVRVQNLALCLDDDTCFANLCSDKRCSHCREIFGYKLLSHNEVSYTDLCESMNHKLRRLSQSQRRSQHSLNSSTELLPGQSYCNSIFFPRNRRRTIFSMDKSGKKMASPAYKPPFPPTSSLIAREDLVLPAAFNDLSPLARELHPLRFEHRDELHRFLCAFFDLSRFNAIRKMLWLIAVHGAPRSLYYQKFLGREIVIAEELGLHLVWAKSRIFIKPLPDFLLNYDFWEDYISCEPQLHRAACGLLYSYCGLIRFGHDLQVAQQCHLVNVNLDYRAWTEFARTVLPNLNPEDSNTMDTRFQYGELRLNRLDTIYRYSPYKLSISSILQGFPHALTESYVPYMEQYNNAVSAFGIIVIVLSAFNLSLSARSKSPDLDLQQAAYGFAIFAMILCAALIAVFIVVPLISSLATIYGSIATHKRLAKRREDEELSRSA